MSKGLKAKDLVGSAPAELESRLKSLQDELFKARMKKSVNQLENVMLIRSTRRDIARVNTVLAARQKTAPAAASGQTTGEEK